jgi:cAMP-dependent protein kinase regulator
MARGPSIPPPGAAYDRPIDKALALAIAGDKEGSLRWAVALLDAEPRVPLRMLITSWMLGLLGRNDVAGRGMRVAVERAIDAANLPLAVAASAKLRDLGGDCAGCLDSVAKAFAKRSPRLLEKRGAPPSLSPGGGSFAPLPESLTGAALIQRAEAVLTKVCDLFDDERKAEPPPQVTPQPLFSSMDERGLRAMIEIFDVRIVPRGYTLVEEASIGDEAYIVARGELDVQKNAHRQGVTPIPLARLGNGAVFGEMALLSRAPRSATVTAAVPSVVLVAHRADLDRVVERAPQVGREFAEYCRRRMLENLVRTNFIFRAASPAERPGLVERFQIRSFEAGERIVTQGGTPDGLHIIALGEVSIVHRDDGERTIMTKLGPGDVVGEVALILRRPPITDVVAHHPTVTLFLPREKFMSLAKAHPKVFVDLYEIAIKRDEETSVMAAEEAQDTDDFVLV